MSIPRAVRAWLYGVAIAIGPLLVVYGIMTTDEVAAWLAVAAAILAPAGVALANLSPGPEPRRGLDDDEG